MLIPLAAVALGTGAGFVTPSLLIGQAAVAPGPSPGELQTRTQTALYAALAGAVIATLVVTLVVASLDRK